MQLYTVSFTTKATVKTYDKRGKIIAETPNDRPVVLTALPYKTAMSYEGCDNFKITNYVQDQPRVSRGSGRDNKVGNGTKRVATRDTTSAASKTVQPAEASVVTAARTGNLGAAINV